MNIQIQKTMKGIYDKCGTCPIRPKPTFTYIQGSLKRKTIRIGIRSLSMKTIKDNISSSTLKLCTTEKCLTQTLSSGQNQSFKCMNISNLEHYKIICQFLFFIGHRSVYRNHLVSILTKFLKQTKDIKND